MFHLAVRNVIYERHWSHRSYKYIPDLNQIIRISEHPWVFVHLHFADFEIKNLPEFELRYSTGMIFLLTINIVNVC